MTKRPLPGTTLELIIGKCAFGGDGIALHEGKVYFVEGALPGERILAGVTEEKKNFSRAVILKILEPSSHRVDPPCPYVEHCGGCQYQHVDYREELRLKETQLAEIFRNMPGVSPEKIMPIAASDSDYGYRHSVTLHPVFSSPKGGSASGGKKKEFSPPGIYRQG